MTFSNCKQQSEPSKGSIEPDEFVEVADALRRISELMHVHFHLARSGITPSDELLPSENSVAAASQLLAWLAAKLAGYSSGDMPALPKAKAVGALRKHLENLRWS